MSLENRFPATLKLPHVTHFFGAGDFFYLKFSQNTKGPLSRYIVAGNAKTKGSSFAAIY